MPDDFALANGLLATHAERRSALLEALERASGGQASVIMEQLSLLGELTAKTDRVGSGTRQRRSGIYYTSFDLARGLVSEAIRLKGSSEGTFFEPCVGGGAFLVAFIEAALMSDTPTKIELEAVLDRCYVADNDDIAIENLKTFLPRYLKVRYGHSVSIPDRNIFLGDSLMDFTESKAKIRDFSQLFGLEDKFDFIVTNPPYLLLKGDSRLGTDFTSQVQELSNNLSSPRLFRYSQGTLNLYKLFTEAIMDEWIADSGVIGLLIPRSLLTDKQSTTLRNHLLSAFELGTIVNLDEGNEHFKAVGQSFSAFAAKKGTESRNISFGSFDSKVNKFEVDTVRDVSALNSVIPNGSLFPLEASEFERLVYLSNASTVSESLSLVNLRGEFDMTFDHGYLTDEDTGLKLLKGSHLGHFSFSESDKYVKPEFLDRPKGKWVSAHRLACQQISNMKSSRRLKWAYIPPGYVLANSCNFIAIDYEKIAPDSTLNLHAILGILNSDLLNWRFKLLSPNNHVSNSEISSFPLGQAIQDPQISALAANLCKSYNEGDLALLNSAVEANLLNATQNNFEQDK